MKQKETILAEYVELFAKYKKEYKEKKDLYRKEHNMEGLTRYSSIDYPGYFEIEDEWQQKRAEIDKPILAMAKYNIYDDIEFRHTGIPPHDPTFRPYDMYSDSGESNLFHGVITEIKTSAMGNGEILYDFTRLVPYTRICNPYCVESDVVGIYKNNPNYRPDKTIIIEDPYWQQDEEYYKCTFCKSILTNEEIAVLDEVEHDKNTYIVNLVNRCTKCKDATHNQSPIGA